MRGLVVLLLTTVVACTVAGPVSPPHSGGPLILQGTTGGDSADLQQRHVISSSPSILSRPRRWILSWLIGPGGLIERSQGKREIASNDTVKQQETSNTAKKVTDIENESDKKSSKGHGVRHSSHLDEDSSAETVDFSAVAPVDLSGDTRVNYQDGRSRIGELASETDAEVFDWDLLQEDRDRNAGDENPHYFQSSSASHNRNSRPISHSSSQSHGAVHAPSSSSYGVRAPSSSTYDSRSPSSSSYGVRARPVSGFVRRTNANGQTGTRLNTFNRFPISYEQSLEFANTRTQSVRRT